MSTLDPELLAVFRTETVESLAIVQEHLMRIEQGGGDAAERLRDVLRLAHDLKGSARVVGLVAAGHLAHAIETRLKSWTPDEPVPGHEMDLVLSAADLLGVLVEQGEDVEPLVLARADRTAALLEDVERRASSPRERAQAQEPGDDAARQHAASTSPAGEDAGPADQAPGGPEGGRAPAIRHGDTLRVSWGLIDDISRHVAEIRVRTEGAYADCKRLDQELQSIEDVRLAYASPTGRAVLEGRNRLRRVLGETQARVHQLAARATELGLLVDELSLKSTRGLASFLERVVRDTARALGKQVDFEVPARDDAVDGQVLQALKGPLTHMVRNAVDHGIEAPPARREAGKPAWGRVSLVVDQGGGRIRISVGDDGAGVDLDALRRRLGDPAATDEELLVRMLDAGVTTRDEVSEFSGRGIGLDAVAAEVERLHGRVSIRTERGAGTTVTLDMPAQLMLVHGIHALAGNVHVVLPIADLTVPDDPRPRPDDVPLASRLGLQDIRAVRDVVAVRRDDGVVRFGVDRVIEEVEVVRRPISPHLGELPCVQGAAVLFDGTPALIIDLHGLEGARVGRRRRADRAACRGQRVLVVDDSTTMRSIFHAALSAAGFEVTLAEDGDAALRCLATRPFDAVVSDVQMPRHDGWRLLDEVGARQPFVLATSRPTPADEERARRAGALAYLNKDDTVGARVTALLDAVLAKTEPNP